jgi:hypothetical protein
MKMEPNQDWWIVVLKEEIGGDWVTVLNLVPHRPYKHRDQKREKVGCQLGDLLKSQCHPAEYRKSSQNVCAHLYTQMWKKILFCNYLNSWAGTDLAKRL